MNLSSIHHIAIIVSDYEAAKRFYVQQLGFEVIRENYRPARRDWKLDLRVNEHTELEIFAEENPPKRPRLPGGPRPSPPCLPRGKHRGRGKSAGGDGHPVRAYPNRRLYRKENDVLL